MQPDPSDLPGINPESDIFLQKMQRPLKYLRRLSADNAEREADALAVEQPDDASDLLGAPAPGEPSDDGTLEEKAGNSVIRRLEKLLGFAPALDLIPPGGDLPAGFEFSTDRYTPEGELGAGGMGRVLLVYDQDIRRRVAMKVLHDDVRDRKAVTRFLEEAQATGQLEHPNIAPVYDIGIDSSGSVFFTMKLVRGRNLGEIIRDLAIGRSEVRQHFTLTRLVQILQLASMGVHYAHVRGVVHRDLKPDNVMVGDFGEVLVMDWGLAKISGRQHFDPATADGVESFRNDSGVVTQDGMIQGTLAYMPPEQARGWRDEIDARTDVFGLGAILYQVLTYHPPYEGKNVREILGKAGVGEITPPSQRAPRNRIPPSLEAICMRALAAAKEERYPDANAFHEALQVYLDGTAEARRHRAEAEQLVRQGKERIAEYRRLREFEGELRLRAREALAGVEEHETAEKKTASWDLEDEASRAHQKRIRMFNDATSSLHSALDVDESCTDAKKDLTNLYWDRFQEAERVGNVDDMTMYRGLVERYDDGTYAAALEGMGTLQVQSDPPGADVIVYRIEERARRMVEVGGQSHGRTPVDLELPMGDHLLILRLDGYRDTRYPVTIERCGRLNVRTKLYRSEEIGEDFLYVPAGEVYLGGDAAAPGALELTQRYVDDIFVSRYPVTFRQYCGFLDELVAEGHPDLPDFLPRTETEGECVVFGVDRHFRPDLDKLVDSPTRDRYPSGFEWDLPVLAITWTAAQTYCDWLSKKVGRRIRLPRETEWEKTARGISRSIHPWGNFFDWSFVKGGSSRAEPAQPEPVGSFPTDISIYGVRDLSGCIREWCDDWFVEGVGRLIRGGFWGNMSPRSFRAAARGGASSSMRSSAIGFRVVAEPEKFSQG